MEERYDEEGGGDDDDDDDDHRGRWRSRLSRTRPDEAREWRGGREKGVGGGRGSYFAFLCVSS